MSIIAEMVKRENQKELFSLTHGTSPYNLILSLLEGGKPATSLALSKISDTETWSDSSLTKFGDIVISLDPKSIFKDEYSIFTRDSYTRDAPNKLIAVISKAALVELGTELERYSSISNSDLIKRITLESKDDVVKISDVVSWLGRDNAFKLNFLNKIGHAVDLPMTSAYEVSDKAIAIVELIGETEVVKMDLNGLSSLEQGALISAYDNYFNYKLESADTKFTQNMYRRYLGRSDSEKLDDATSALKEWVLAKQNPNDQKIDMRRVDKVINDAVNEAGLALFELELLKVANQLGEDFIYTCDQEVFSCKADAWEYIHENSGVNSQQGLTFSKNEIFSLLATEISSSQVYDNLDLINPRMFVGGGDAVQDGFDVGSGGLEKFGELFDEVRESVGLKSSDRSFRKDEFVDLVMSNKGMITSELLAKSGFVFSDGVDGLALLSKFNECLGNLTGSDIEIINFNRLYHRVSDLKSDLNDLLEVYLLSSDAGRDFYKEVLPLLNGDGFTFDSVISARSKYGCSEHLRENEISITTIIESLKEAFDALPDDVPYFELITKDTLYLESESVKAIHVPSELQKFINVLGADYPEILDKITYYETDKPGDLTRSVIESGGVVDKDALKTEPELGLSDSRERTTKEIARRRLSF